MNNKTKKPPTAHGWLINKNGCTNIKSQTWIHKLIKLFR